MKYIVLDLEATCWQEKTGKQNEIIEIGAVAIDEDREVLDEFNAFVRPTLHPTLSTFCTELTSIQQHDVDQADTFPTVITQFWDWIATKDYYLCSWGHYDRIQFKNDCELHDLDTKWLVPHISLKHQYSEIKFTRKRFGMKRALQREGFSLDGTHHRGIDDARNISKLFLMYFDFWIYT
ncbi:MAG: exonuclease domain-containing protein [Saprospiraceae bacterium]|nr:exonuclease domain-containing protein [Saprospiraceae bacterium]